MRSVRGHRPWPASCLLAEPQSRRGPDEAACAGDAADFPAGLGDPRHTLAIGELAACQVIGVSDVSPGQPLLSSTA